jgi:hypothetical protein
MGERETRGDEKPTGEGEKGRRLLTENKQEKRRKENCEEV